jgi:hypothetical protein
MVAPTRVVVDMVSPLTLGKDVGGTKEPLDVIKAVVTFRRMS